MKMSKQNNLDVSSKSDSIFPGEDWEYYDSPEEAGYASEVFQEINDRLEGMPTSSFMVVVKGKIAYSYGDISEVSYCASSRKSIMSLLYGNYVKAGVINLDSTLEKLGIDDVSGLLPIEKQAKVRDILISSSGVFHPQGSPGGDTAKVPERGSKKPGEYYMYSNWDFNVAGTIFEQQTNQTVFEALNKDLAIPLEFQDYDQSRQRKLGYDSNAVSKHLAYHMFLSGRDMARIGWLVVNKGKWHDKQIVPKEWIEESVKISVHSDDMNDRSGNRVHYGYYWWLPEEKSPEWKGAFLAAGNYGQYILGIPALDMVIVHRRAVSDEFAINRNLGIDKSNPSKVYMETVIEIADSIIKGKRNK